MPKELSEQPYSSKPGCRIYELENGHYVYNADITVITVEDYKSRPTLHRLYPEVNLFCQFVSSTTCSEAGVLLGMRFHIKSLISIIDQIMEGRSARHQFKYNQGMRAFVRKIVTLWADSENNNNFTVKTVKGMGSANWVKQRTMFYNQVCRSHEYKENRDSVVHSYFFGLMLLTHIGYTGKTTAAGSTLFKEMIGNIEASNATLAPPFRKVQQLMIDCILFAVSCGWEIGAARVLQNLKSDFTLPITEVMSTDHQTSYGWCNL